MVWAGGAIWPTDAISIPLAVCDGALERVASHFAAMLNVNSDAVMLSGLVLRQTIAAAAKSRRGGKEGRDAKLMEMTLDSARAPHCVNYAPKWTLWPDCWLQFVGPYLTVARLALAPPP